MQSPLPSPSIRQIPHASDPRPSKRAKIAAAGQYERRGGRAKAERWYNDSNNNAAGTKDIAYLDNDPPFYLNKTTCSGGGSACAVYSNGSTFDTSNLDLPTAPTRSLLAQMEANESNSEDFRSVIDDLTIQNKRLRKKLKQYQRLHCSHLQEEKLFEVRIHALAAHRKRELEQILRSFASSSGDSPGTSIFNVANFKASSPALMDPNPSSSSTSYSKDSKPIDSAYASISGQAGVSQKPSQDQPQNVRQAQSHSGQQKVKSYLQDIPETLVPKDSLAMSERAKSRLLVRRLEEIFTGRRAATTRQNQAHQQQEVSQSATQADRIRLESRGFKIQPKQEGVREARILPTGAELKVDSLSEASLATQQSQLAVENRGRNPRKEGLREARILSGCAESQIDSSSETNLTGQQSRQSTDGEDSRSRDPRISRGVTPDQRPTRPIDLDLHRAQVPSDNIEYIRHLGLASPTTNSDAKPDSDDGWVFLNLLISMAQLHTLNVTPDFIRHAIAEVSSKFELSADGTKVKWQGGTDGTQMGSDSDDSDEIGNRESTDTCTSVSKRGVLADMPSRAGPEHSEEANGAPPFPTVGPTEFSEIRAKRQPVYLEHPNDVDKFQYKPLFFHGTAYKDEDPSAYSTDSVSSCDPMENSTGLNSHSHGIRESDVTLRKPIRENGPIIFYNKAKFCTDLSGDATGAMHDKATYSRYTQEPIGSLQQADSEIGDESESGYVAHEDAAVESTMDLANGSTSTTRSALDLEELRSSISDLSATSPIRMEVSGLGGIQPEDNFMVKVKVRHRGRRRSSRAPSPLSAPSSQIRRLLRSIPRGPTNTYREAKDIPRSQPSRGPIKSEIISTVKTDMPPSSLPPPSYICLPFSSSESDDGDDEDEDANMNYQRERPRASAETSVEDLAEPRPGTLFLGSSTGESAESSYLSTTNGSDDDSSIDFLANARELDPDTIAAQEREFEIHSVQQRARAGSMAVTLGELTSSGSGPARMAKMESDANSMSVDGEAED